nr:response regulator transcription factor [Paracraurococcus ruber]
MVDDHPLVLAGIRALLEGEAGIRIIGEATDGRTAIAAATALRPDVAVLDMSLPGANGVEVARALGEGCPGCRCVALTVQEDRVYVRRMLEVGVSGYVLKRSVAPELVRAVRAVAAGSIYLDPAIAAHALEPRPRIGAAPAETATSALTQRETEVLRLTVAGHSNKAVAKLLGLSVKTIETHKARAAEKLGLRDRVALLRYAREQGWLGETLE